MDACRRMGVDVTIAFDQPRQACWQLVTSMNGEYERQRPLPFRPAPRHGLNGCLSFPRISTSRDIAALKRYLGKDCSTNVHLDCSDCSTTEA